MVARGWAEGRAPLFDDDGLVIAGRVVDDLPASRASVGKRLRPPDKIEILVSHHPDASVQLVKEVGCIFLWQWWHHNSVSICMRDFMLPYAHIRLRRQHYPSRYHQGTTCS